jgi:hypothetical protein
MTDPSNPSLEVARKRFADVEAQLNDIYLEISMIEQRRARCSSSARSAKGPRVEISGPRARRAKAKLSSLGLRRPLS